MHAGSQYFNLTFGTGGIDAVYSILDPVTVEVLVTDSLSPSFLFRLAMINLLQERLFYIHIQVSRLQ